MSKQEEASTLLKRIEEIEMLLASIVENLHSIISVVAERPGYSPRGSLNKAEELKKLTLAKMLNHTKKEDEEL